MQSARTSLRLPTVYKFCKEATPLAAKQTRNMSFFPRAFPSGDFAPLFRLLDDYDVHRSGSPKGSGFQSIRAFQPKFDVKEIKDGYELHGELPGIEQKDISIEFSDPQTLTIRGRTEREYSSGTPPALESSSQPAGAITEAGDEAEKSKYHKATVEDEENKSNATDTTTTASEGAATPTSDTQVTKSASQTKQPAAKEESKWWVNERSIGEFSRTFAFPQRVDQEAVKASLKNGILNIVVPKAAAPKSKRISIE